MKAKGFDMTPRIIIGVVFLLVAITIVIADSAWNGARLGGAAIVVAIWATQMMTRA